MPVATKAKAPVKKTVKPAAKPAAAKKPIVKKAAPKKAAPAAKAAPKTKTGKQTIEEIKVTGDQLVKKVKELVKEGNVRRIIIKQRGKRILEIPLTLAVIGVAFAPLLAAVGALAALITECTLEVERD